MPVTVHPAPANGTYEPAVTSIFVPAESTYAVTGTVAASHLNRFPVKQISRDSAVAWTMIFPAAWVSVDMILWWTNPDPAGVGDVVWDGRIASIAEGQTTTDSEATAPDAAWPAPAYKALEKSTIWQGFAVTPGELAQLHVLRSSIGDTFGPGALSLFGVELQKAS